MKDSTLRLLSLVLQSRAALKIRWAVACRNSARPAHARFKPGRFHRMASYVLVLGLVTSACATGTGDGAAATETTDVPASTAETREEPSPGREALAGVAVTGLTFVDTPFGSTLTISVSPNDDVEQIDVYLAEEDVVTSITAETSEGPVHIGFGDNTYVVSMAGHNLTARGVIGGSEVTVISGGEATTYPVDPLDVSSGSGHSTIKDAHVQLTSYTATDSAPVAVEEDDALGYRVDRPTRILAEVLVDVVSEVDGEPLDLREATGYGPIVENCSADTTYTGFLSCTPYGADQILVAASLEIPRGDLDRPTVFESRERCEEWSKLNADKGTVLGWIGGALSAAVAVGNPAAGAMLAGLSRATKFAFDQEAGHPCGTVTVSDELVQAHLDANENFTITLEATAFAWEYDFTVDTTQVRPFPAEDRVSGPIRLEATPREDVGSSPEGQLEWSAELEPPSDLKGYDEIAGTVTITREPGTDDFDLVAVTTRTTAQSFLVEDQIDPVECTSTSTSTLDAAGTFSADGAQLLFNGTETTVYDYSDCPGEGPAPSTSTWTNYSVEITDSGLSGNFGYSTFTLPGRPPKR